MFYFITTGKAVTIVNKRLISSEASGIASSCHNCCSVRALATAISLSATKGLFGRVKIVGKDSLNSSWPYCLVLVLLLPLPLLLLLLLPLVLLLLLPLVLLLVPLPLLLLLK